MAQQKGQNMKKKILNSFLDYYLEHGKHPSSVFKFAKELGIKEQDFYQYFGSFRGIEKSIWKELMTDTIESLHKDKAYNQYGIREKLLAFYYTHLEHLSQQRSFILLSSKDVKLNTGEPYFLREYRQIFFEFVRGLIDAGLESGEIANRKYISDHYEKGFWLQLLFILQFWIKDDSASFEQTDAAIEKAVNLSFDLIGKGPIESMVDFAKFIYQNR